MVLDRRLACTYVMVHSSVPANSIKELIALLKANPGKYNYGTPGNGAPGHLATEMFKSLTGTHIVHIPFKGAGPAAIAFLAGDIQIVFGVMVGLTQHIKSGRVKVLAVTTDTRSRFAPDVPTLSELGLPGFNMSAWLGMLGPAGMSKEIVRRNRDAVAKALGLPDVQEILTAQGFEGVGSTPEEFLAFLQADVGRSAQIVKTAGVRAD